MYFPTPSQMRTIEENAEKNGLSRRELMERAGDALAMNIVKAGAETADLRAGTVFLCGSGNNGGDGFAAARMLAETGYPATIVLVNGDPSTELSVEQYCDLSGIKGLQVLNMENGSAKILEIMSKAAIIVDAVFGIGFHGALPKPVRDCFAFAEKCSALKIAADVPSGGDCLNGTAADGALKCDITVAFGHCKAGMVCYPLSEYCGKIIVENIGLTDEFLTGVEYLPVLFGKEDAEKLIPEREKNAYKGDFGKLLNVAGCARMSGAALLSTKAALRSGTGLVTLASTETVISRISSEIPEATFLVLDSDRSGGISKRNASSVTAECENKTALSVGCGLSVGDDSKSLVKNLIKNADCPIILDADGINCIADDIDIIRNAKHEAIVTPHAGELARLSAMSTEEVASDRLTAAVNIARQYGVTVVAKGVPTFVAGGGRVYIIPAGNPGLSRGGSGDVLTGIIASFRAQGYSATDASALGVYVHGAAADIAAETLSETGMLPSDVIKCLSFVFKKMNR